jgi:hypothetical protein
VRRAIIMLALNNAASQQLALTSTDNAPTMHAYSAACRAAQMHTFVRIAVAAQPQLEAITHFPLYFFVPKKLSTTPV